MRRRPRCITRWARPRRRTGGLITRFGQLRAEGGPLYPELGREPSRSYGVKATADYGSVEEAQQLDGEAAVREGKEFVRPNRGTFLATGSKVLE